MKSHEWTQKQVKSASVPNYGKKYIDQPNFLKLIGDVENKKVLELGSGNGYWLELLDKRGAKCTGIELAEKQLELAITKNKTGNITYILGDITKLDKIFLKEKSYDVILLNHVLLEISSISKLKKIFKSASRLLKKGGKIVIADLHPFSPSMKPDNIRTDKSYNYFSSGDVFHVVSKRIDGQEILYKDFHWTLSDIITSITDSGLKISKLIEPKPTIKQTEKYPALKYRLDIPMSIMIEIVK